MTKQDIIERAKRVSLSSNPRDYIEFVGELAKENDSVPTDVEEAAEKYNEMMSWAWEAPNHPHKVAFIAGAEWKLTQLMKEAVEGVIKFNMMISGRCAAFAEVNPKKFKPGEEVSVIIIKKEK